MVVFRYLLTVKRWFALPELHRYTFSTLAWQSMSSAVYSERKKQERHALRMDVYSLDEEIPGTDGMTPADIITNDNLLYVQYC